MSNKVLPQGLRIHNPGNLEYDGKTQWQGLDDVNPVYTDNKGRKWFRFKDGPSGIRAMCRTLITYQDKRKAHDGSKIDTIADIVQRWAPPHENDTAAYIRSVDSRHPKTATDTLDLHSYEDLRPLIPAIIQHENGMQPYTDAQIDRGLAMAGVLPAKPKSLQASRTVKGAQLAGGTGVLATVTGGAVAIAPAVPVIREVADFANTYPWILLIGVGLAALVGGGVVIYAKWDERRRGLA